MDNNQGPIGPQAEQKIRPFTQKALDTKFSFSFTRKQLVVLINAISTIQFPMADQRRAILGEVYDEIQRTAFNALTEADYEDGQPVVIPEKPAIN